MSYKIPYAGAEPKGRPALRKRAKKPARISKPLSKITSRDISCAFDSGNSYVITDNRPIELPAAPISLKKILLEVCTQYDLHPNDLVGNSRALRLIKARREFIWRGRNETQYSFPRIAKAINRDHTTVIYHYYYMKSLKKSEAADIKFAKKIPKSKRYKDQVVLTERQEMIRTLFIRGFTVIEVAVEIGICPTTVKHERTIINKIHPIPTFGA